MWKVILFRGFIFVYGISSVVQITGNPVYYAVIGPVAIFPKTLLLISGDSAVLNLGGKLVE